MKAHMDSVRTINYHPSRPVLMSSGRDGSVKLWDAKDNKHHPLVLGNLVGHSQNVAAASFILEVAPYGCCQERPFDAIFVIFRALPFWAALPSRKSFGQKYVVVGSLGVTELYSY